MSHVSHRHCIETQAHMHAAYTDRARACLFWYLVGDVSGLRCRRLVQVRVREGEIDRSPESNPSPPHHPTQRDETRGNQSSIIDRRPTLDVGS